VVCLIWSRLGTRLPGGFPRRADGTAYESGTVYEYETARAASRLTGGKQPDLFMFRTWRLPATERAAPGRGRREATQGVHAP